MWHNDLRLLLLFWVTDVLFISVSSRGQAKGDGPVQTAALLISMSEFYWRHSSGTDLPNLESYLCKTRRETLAAHE